MSRTFYRLLQICLAATVFGPAIVIVGQKFASIYEFANRPLNGFGSLTAVALPAVAVAMALLAYPLYVVMVDKAFAGALAAVVSPIAMAINLHSFGGLSASGSFTASQMMTAGISIMAVALALFVIGDRLRHSKLDQNPDTRIAN